MIQVVLACLAATLMAAALLVGVGSNVPDAMSRQRFEGEAVAGFSAVRSAADAFRVANRGAEMAPDAAGDLAAYMPAPPALSDGLSWTMAGGSRPTACLSSRAPSPVMVDALARAAARLGGRLAADCGGAAARRDGGPAALVVPLSAD